ncbi:MAG TPA: AAA family ATPase [Anaerolineae bacterium]|nr:AAA family ATPase [Anaerolineae bacterium]
MKQSFSTPDLFDHAAQETIARSQPLAARMRPRTLDEYVGQDEIVGANRLLRRAIETDKLFSSILLWGPPGTGKTTLAMVIANTTKSYFEQITAVMSGVADIRRIVSESQERLKLYRQRTILLVDEIHRFNKAQQDALLPHVENGTLILIGATTENPYFEVIGPLVSRSRVFQLKPLSDDNVRVLLDRALHDSEHGYGQLSIKIDPDAIEHLVHIAGGDARNALNALELAVESTPLNTENKIHVTLDVAQESIQRRAILYDKDGDAHYDTISAFIKSVRGSDPDAALYWLAKMLYAGEDPRFILRRLVILAGEDIGLADPLGLVVANSAVQAFEFIGLPEGVYPIVEATIYLATAPKSNSAGAYFRALKQVEAEGKVEVPRHLQDTNRDAKALGHGAGYQYPHSFDGHHVPQNYLPEAIKGMRFYDPSDQGHEAQVNDRLERWRKAGEAALAIEPQAGPEVTEQEIIGLKKKIR